MEKQVNSVERFTGAHFLQLDEKGRTPIPAKLYPIFKARTQRELNIADEKALPELLPVVVSASPNGFIGVFTEACYEQILQDLRDPNSARFSDLNAQERLIMAMDMENTCEVQRLDKQNRFTIPEGLLEAAKVPRRAELAVVGNIEYIEVQTKAAWINMIGSRLQRWQSRRNPLQGQAKEPVPAQ